MSQTILYLGNKNYSSWSMRPWLCAKYVGLDFKEIVIPIRTENSATAIAKISPSKKVPCLHHNGLVIWDSLAIAEYLNEIFPAKELLPHNSEKRALARSIVAEMHSGFMDFRKEFPMNCKAKVKKAPSQAAQNNVERILDIWRDARRKYRNDGEFLLGKFSIADAFFAPVISRMISYDIDFADMKNYGQTIINLPFYKEWQQAALQESWIIKEFE